MAYVNVNRSNEDQFYRYKMPSLIAKVTDVIYMYIIVCFDILTCLYVWSYVHCMYVHVHVLQIIIIYYRCWLISCVLFSHESC